MNPYDAAHLLAKTMRESQEFKDFRDAQAGLKNDQSAREMLNDFRSQQFNLQRQKLSGLEIAPEQEDKLEKLYQVISMNLTIKRFLEVEYRLGVLIGDIQKIITEAAGELIDPEMFGLSGEEDEGEE